MDGAKRSSVDDLTKALQSASDGGLQKASFNALQAQASGGQALGDLSLVMDLPVVLTVELGRTKMTLGELMGLQGGAILELNARAGDPLNLVVNGCLLARGEVVVNNDRFGVRITDVVSPSERLKNLRSSA